MPYLKGGKWEMEGIFLALFGIFSMQCDFAFYHKSIDLGKFSLHEINQNVIQHKPYLTFTYMSLVGTTT